MRQSKDSWQLAQDSSQLMHSVGVAYAEELQAHTFCWFCRMQLGVSQEQIRDVEPEQPVEEEGQAWPAAFR